MSTVRLCLSPCGHVPENFLFYYFLVANEQIGQGTGATKGDAGEAAAQAAYENLSRAP